MIYIFSAFYAEAKNIIDHYGLKKEKSPEMVRFDVFANESIRLVITGVGEINAAAAVSNIGGAYGISPDDEILNVGSERFCRKSISGSGLSVAYFGGMGVLWRHYYLYRCTGFGFFGLS